MFLLITLLLVISLGVAAVSLFLVKRKALPPPQTYQPPINPRSLFAPDEAEIAERQKVELEQQKRKSDQDLRADLTKRASENDFNALIEAKIYDGNVLYEEVFARLSENDPETLVRFVTKNSLPSMRSIIEFSAKKMYENPTLENFQNYLQLSALSNSADIYLDSLETISKLTSEKKFSEISGEKLITILESQYWLLAPQARISGAGFLIKEKMASLCREIRGK